ncbi:MAG: hypothetical protein SFX18_14880 [Pirellulales bacterium]|nr:hypothetical protein [Pirellulales bacterium]
MGFDSATEVVQVPLSHDWGGGISTEIPSGDGKPAAGEDVATVDSVCAGGVDCCSVANNFVSPATAQQDALPALRTAVREGFEQAEHTLAAGSWLSILAKTGSGRLGSIFGGFVGVALPAEMAGMPLLAIMPQQVIPAIKPNRYLPVVSILHAPL